MQAGCCAREVQFFGDGNEVSEMSEFKHRTILDLRGLTVQHTKYFLELAEIRYALRKGLQVASYRLKVPDLELVTWNLQPETAEDA